MSGHGDLCVGVDVGTSGLKAVATTRGGEVAAEASADYPLLTPEPGWTEQEPLDWWEAASSALRELTAGVGAERVAAVGVSGQMHGMVPLDSSGAPIRPALLWNDQRTADQVAEIERAVPRAELVRRTGNPAVTGFQLPKVLWLRRHEPDAFARLATVLFPKDWIAFRLTGELASEATDASGSGAFSLRTGDWDDELLQRLDLDRRRFPDLVPSSAVTGTVTREAATTPPPPRRLDWGAPLHGSVLSASAPRACCSPACRNLPSTRSVECTCSHMRTAVGRCWA
jgi:xylulokinase